MHTFKTTKIFMKELKESTPEKPKYKSKNIIVPFTCDLDDIKFVDVAFKSTGEPYEAKCLITHNIKGDIIVNISRSKVLELLNNKYKTGHVRIKGFGK